MRYLHLLGRSHVYTWVVEKPALVPNTFKTGVRLATRAYLAIKLELGYTNTGIQKLQHIFCIIVRMESAARPGVPFLGRHKV